MGSFIAQLDAGLQVAATFYYVFMFVVAPLPCVGLFLYLIFYTPLWIKWIPLLYAAWIIYDRKTSERGGRPSAWHRNSVIWRYLVDYFPIKLHKTADLPADRNYIFGSHPHGIMGIGTFASLCTNATGFDKKFPNLQRVAVTLPCMFYFPFRREMVIDLGGISSNRESIEYVLKRGVAENRPTIVSIVLGGAEEALDAHPNNYDLKLATRKGFVKLAIRNGASLVPVYHFGENALFKQFPNEHGSKLRKFQMKFKNVLGIAPPFFYGVGVLNRSFGFMPFRKPINTVVGKPIEVDKIAEPTQQQIDAVHARYCKELSELFDAHKEQFGLPETAHLNFV